MAYKALLVAVNQYRHPGVLPLPNTAHDVAEIERLFLAPPSRFASADVEVYSQTSARLATLRPALDRFFISAKPDDVLLLYWAGHGALVGNDGFLTPMDVDPNNIPGTSINIAEVRSLIDQSSARAAMACFDTCHSGAIARGISTMRGLEVQGQGRVVIAACTH